MRGSAKRVAYMSVLTALGAVILFLTQVFPSGRLGLMLIASFPVCAALMMYGSGWALCVFCATALLGFLLFPGAAAVAYAAFFGYYPIAKSFFERGRVAWLRWSLKYGLYITAFALCWFLAKAIFSGSGVPLPWYALLLIGAVCFGIYDWCYSVVIRFYLDKIARYLT